MLAGCAGASSTTVVSSEDRIGRITYCEAPRLPPTVPRSRRMRGCGPAPATEAAAALSDGHDLESGMACIDAYYQGPDAPAVPMPCSRAPFGQGSSNSPADERLRLVGTIAQAVAARAPAADPAAAPNALPSRSRMLTSDAFHTRTRHVPSPESPAPSRTACCPSPCCRSLRCARARSPSSSARGCRRRPGCRSRGSRRSGPCPRRPAAGR